MCCSGLVHHINILWAQGSCVAKCSWPLTRDCTWCWWPLGLFSGWGVSVQLKSLTGSTGSNPLTGGFEANFILVIFYHKIFLHCYYSTKVLIKFELPSLSPVPTSSSALESRRNCGFNLQPPLRGSDALPLFHFLFRQMQVSRHSWFEMRA